MNLTILLTKQILSMILMAAGGYVLGKRKVITGEHGRVLSCFCVYLASPCCIINGFSTGRDMDKLTGLALGLAAAAAIQLMFYGVTRLLSLGPKGLSREEVASTFFDNAGNLVMPMVNNTLGPEYVIYNTPYILIQNILLWTYGKKIMGGSQRFSLKKLLTNPIILSMEIGLVLFFTGWQMPEVVAGAVSATGASIAPVGMVLIGVLLSDLDLRGAFLQARIYYVAAIRLLLLPLLTIPLLIFIGRLWPHPDGLRILTVCLLSAIGPAAATILQQATLYHNPHTGYLSSINVLTTLFCGVTMPLINALFQWLI